MLLCGLSVTYNIFTVPINRATLQTEKLFIFKEKTCFYQTRFVEDKYLFDLLHLPCLENLCTMKK